MELTVLQSKIFEIRGTKVLLGVGGVKARCFFYKKMVNAGWIHFSVCPKNIIARSFDQKIEGADIFPNTFLGPNIQIGVGTLINTRSNIYHDTIIGDFCDIAPSSILLGGVVVGDCTFIGSGDTTLPRIKINNNVTIGAGSVVNSDIPSNVIALSVPAKVVNKI